MQVFTRKAKLMGSAFTLGIVAKSEQQATNLLNLGIAEIQRLEALLSEFIETADTTLINQNAYQSPTLVSPECFGLLQQCEAISNLTTGDFDITVGALKKLYQFKNEAFEMPSKGLIKKTLAAIGYQNIQLNPSDRTVKYTAPNLQISFAAIGKGYAADRVKHLWQQRGVTAGYINASGDLTAFGKKPDGAAWDIGISNPDNNSILLHIPLQNMSAATSGDYEQHFTYKGERYSHNINPHTGYPLQGLKSVTVISPSAALSDALATAVYVKGVKQGLNFIEQLPKTHCILMDEKNKVYFSKNLNYENTSF